MDSGGSFSGEYPSLKNYGQNFIINTNGQQLDLQDWDYAYLSGNSNIYLYGTGGMKIITHGKCDLDGYGNTLYIEDLTAGGWIRLQCLGETYISDAEFDDVRLEIWGSGVVDLDTINFDDITYSNQCEYIAYCRAGGSALQFDNIDFQEEPGASQYNVWGYSSVRFDVTFMDSDGYAGDDPDAYELDDYDANGDIEFDT